MKLIGSTKPIRKSGSFLGYFQSSLRDSPGFALEFTAAAGLPSDLHFDRGKGFKGGGYAPRTVRHAG
jgi:hypothetical protein